MESASNGQPASPTFCPAENRRYVLVAAILASALGFIDGSVVAIAMPAIRSDIGATLAGAQWISNGYMLTLSALILVAVGASSRERQSNRIWRRTPTPNPSPHGGGGPLGSAILRQDQ